MKNLITRHRYIATTAALTLWCCLAQAEDIEVYRSETSGISPVSLIVMDTSGSMDWDVVVDSPDYDPSINYKEFYTTDPDGDAIPYEFDPSLYYFSDDYSGDDLTNSDINDLKERPFPIAALVCEQAQTAIATAGSYSDRFKRWNPSTNVWDPSVDIRRSFLFFSWWETPDTPIGSSSDSSALIECKSDGGTHPAGEFVNTNPDNSNQYETYKVNDYNDTWRNNFPYIYHGNFLNYKTYTSYHPINVIQSRMQITVDAAKHLVNTTGGIRLGLSRFNSSGNGGYVDVAVEEIETARTSLTTKLDSYIPPSGGTPLSESFYEAALYLRGDNIQYGSSSVSTSRTNNTYNSPIESGCQNISNLVLFTDGVPTNDDAANQYIQALLTSEGIDFTTEPNLTDYDRTILTNDCANADLGFDENGSDAGDGTCAEELAYFLANYDQSPAPDGLPGKQTIHTHTIGGFFDESSSSSDAVLTYMENIARFGKGTYSAASSREEIVESFTQAVLVTLDDPVTFVAPAVAANAYNSLEHLDQLYYAVFVPSADNNWQGNLKSYRLSPDGIVVDAAGNAAIDSSGLFKDTSRSYWTDPTTTDGADVIAGGAAANLTAEHKIFTHLSDNTGPLTTTLTIANGISKDKLGLADDTSTEEHQVLLDWLNRKEADGTRTQMEDPLHSRPVVVNYGYDLDPVSNRITTNAVVFVGTNSGYLQAFKADKDQFQEYFSYIPQELLANANFYRTADIDAQKIYGVDGPINYWHEDANQNSQVDEEEKVYLFFGLRRGGRHYYALDITDPENPKFQWKISGGQGDDFDKMGESWSPMTLAKVNWNGGTKVVLLFGGGYDIAEDDSTSREAHAMGNSVYMIDPEHGTLLWSASSNSGATTILPDMTSAITSEIKTVDFDGDLITDYFFVSDIGGRVWRFDINEETTTDTNFIASAGVIFDANSGTSSYQRFYDAPSISYFSNSATNEKYLTLSIGSGFRAHPLQSSQDSFYIIKDTNILAPPSTYITLKPSDFDDIPSGSQLSTAVVTKGWKYELATGEKVLSTPLTSNGNMYFTTFTPTAASSSATCTADIGTSLAYSVDFLGDDDPSADPTSPLISATSIPNIGIAPPAIALNISDTGQEIFCESNPSHESCQPDDCEATHTCPDDCESTSSVILSGTKVLDSGPSSCDLVKKNYWHSL